MNEYTPWIEKGQTELEYWKQKYIDSRAELFLAAAAYRGLKCLYTGEMCCALPWEDNVPIESIAPQGDKK